jgi:hypothetical protein
LPPFLLLFLDYSHTLLLFHFDLIYLHKGHMRACTFFYSH